MTIAWMAAAVRSFVFLPILAAFAATAADASASPSLDHPLHQLAAREHPDRILEGALGRAFLSPTGKKIRPPLPTAASTLDCEHAKHDVTLDAATGATTASMDLRVRAKGGSLVSVGLSFDQGLVLGNVTVPGRTVAVNQADYAPITVAYLDISPAIPAGETATIHIEYQGTLSCAPDKAGEIICAKGRDFSYFAHQSVIPYLFDPQQPYDTTMDAMTREIVMRVPAADDVIATGEKTSEEILGGTKISTWTIGQPLSRALGLYVFAGQLGLKPVGGRSVPTTLIFPAPEQSVDGRLASWSAPVLDFVEGIAGTKLPFSKSMSLVRLPKDLGDPGTATFGMTLLSEMYADAGPVMHEETWAHENSHLFWGILVPERDAFESKLLSEGLATLTEIEYTYARHFAAQDHDLYLARRFVPIGLELRSVAEQLPPILLAPGATIPANQRTPLWTLWAYYKTAATLDHLRATIGDDAFTKVLAEYVNRCQYVGCRPDDFRSVVESVTKKDLRPFFARWVNASSRPHVTIAFAPVPGGAEVDISKPDDDPMTLELWVRAEDGVLTKQRVDLAGQSTRIRLDVAAGVRSVAASPRHDLMVDAQSAVDGDIDFDGETDGFDILRCSRLSGRSYTPLAGTGLWLVDEPFDPRCDRNGDNKIDDADFELLGETFGTLRTP
jgi:hypothetical protein